MNKLPSVKVMRCSETRRLVQRSLDGEELSTRLKKSYEAHLVRCPTCNLWAKQLEMSLIRLKYLVEPRPTLAFQSRLMRVLGLSPVPRLLKWGAAVALALSTAWVVSVLLAGVFLPDIFNKGLPWFYKTGHLLTLVIGKTAGSAGFVTGLAEVGLFFILGSTILLVMGILASRMMHRRLLTVRSI